MHFVASCRWRNSSEFCKWETVFKFVCHWHWIFPVETAMVNCRVLRLFEQFLLCIKTNDCAVHAMCNWIQFPIRMTFSYQKLLPKKYRRNENWVDEKVESIIKLSQSKKYGEKMSVYFPKANNQNFIAIIPQNTKSTIAN